MRKLTAIHLDYASEPRSARWRGSFGLIMACALLALVVVGDVVLDARIDGFEKELETLQAAERRRAAQAVRTPARDQALQTALDALSVPWEPMFDAIEQAVTDSVRILSIEPMVQRRQVRLTAQAPSNAELVAFVTRLNESARGIRKAVITQHEKQVLSPSQETRFIVEADWVFE